MSNATTTTRTQSQPDETWRVEAIQHLRGELEEEIAARNSDLSAEDAIALADQISHEIIDDMAARGDITFEHDLRSSRHDAGAL